MRVTLIIALIVSSLFTLNGQRVSIPKDNPNNALDLKVVFQKYTEVQSRNWGGRTYKKRKYPLLKINDFYLEDDKTGINKEDFENYLANCDRSLDLGLSGLNYYKKSNQSKTISNLGFLGLTAGSLYFGFRHLKEKEMGNLGNQDRNIGIGLLAGAIATKITFNIRSKNQYKLANKQIIDAFDLYRQDCYDSTAENPLSIQSANKTDNGDYNDKEKILINVHTNSINSTLWTFGPVIGYHYYSNPIIEYGLVTSLFKKGFALDASYYRGLNFNKLISDNFQDLSNTQQGGSLLLGIPFFRNTKPGKTPLFLGQSQGLSFNGTTEDVRLLKTIALNAGIDHYQEYVLDHDLEMDHYVTSTFARGGINLSMLSELSFIVNDNRFDDRKRYGMFSASVYMHVLYRISSSFERVNDLNPLVVEPDYNDIGYVIGMNIKSTAKRASRFGAVYCRLEGGKYPTNNAYKDYGFKVALGYSFYSIR